MEGVFNEPGEYIHIVGFGQSSEYPANIETLDYAGNLWIAGDITNGQGETLHAAMQAILKNDCGWSITSGTRTIP